ncbi:hypothetical protein M407DRAFT_244919 [Tulasnella calospora MUT 4182]|uniref:Uncharacterized protein n=1 Tax=Tulasnella calospora MUT 4182 TaxID=1051891 RepID=A0A0C3QDW0_9AGAM|nr:hypothetical protein M407DRAFT_244919 [Tulasnella calospora MUT 4182]
MWENFWTAQQNRLYPDPSVFWLDLRHLRIGRPSGHSGTDCHTMLQSALTFVENRNALGLPGLERVSVYVCKGAALGKARGCSPILPRLRNALSSSGALEITQITSSDMNDSLDGCLGR